jgi:hypothetical protein
MEHQRGAAAHGGKGAAHKRRSSAMAAAAQSKLARRRIGMCQCGGSYLAKSVMANGVAGLSNGFISVSMSK